MKVRRGAKKIRLQGKRQNHSKFSKPKTGMHSVVQTVWEGKDSVRKNLQKLGVSDDPNRTTAFCASPTGSSGIDPQDVFSLPPAERRDRNPRRRPMSAEDQAYIVKLLMVHGNDYKAMERDMEVNCWQHGEAKLKSMAARYRGLSSGQRLVSLHA